MSVQQVLHVRMAPRVLTPLVDISVVVPVDSKENIAIKVIVPKILITLGITYQSMKGLL